MLVRISKAQASRLIKEASDQDVQETLGAIKWCQEFYPHIEHVNPFHLRSSVHITFLRDDQSPEKRAGFHLQF